MQGREAFHTLSHTPSPSAPGSPLPARPFTQATASVVRVPSQLSYRAKHSKNLNTFAPGSGYPVI